MHFETSLSNIVRPPLKQANKQWNRKIKGLNVVENVKLVKCKWQKAVNPNKWSWLTMVWHAQPFRGGTRHWTTSMTQPSSWSANFFKTHHPQGMCGMNKGLRTIRTRGNWGYVVFKIPIAKERAMMVGGKIVLYLENWEVLTKKRLQLKSLRNMEI